MAKKPSPPEKPSLLDRIIGSRKPSGSDATGEPAIDPYHILQHTHADVPTPTQAPNWHSLRSHNPITRPGYIEELEATTLEERAKELKAMAAATCRAYRAMQSIDDSDTGVEVAHYAYLETLATNEGKRLGAKTRLGKTLHGLRPLFDRFANQLELADARASQRIEHNRAAFHQRLNGLQDKLPTIDVQPK